MLARARRQPPRSASTARASARPRRGLDVAVDGRAARVELELAARYGAVLPELAQAVQAGVADALRELRGARVDRVDVAIEELDQ